MYASFAALYYHLVLPFIVLNQRGLVDYCSLRIMVTQIKFSMY